MTSTQSAVPAAISEVEAYCNAALISLEYVKAVLDGRTIHCTDPSDPVDAQQVFVNSALVEHSDRLHDADNSVEELSHAIFDCIDALLKRILDKFLPRDLPADVPIALLGGELDRCDVLNGSTTQLEIINSRCCLWHLLMIYHE